MLQCEVSLTMSNGHVLDAYRALNLTSDGGVQHSFAKAAACIKEGRVLSVQTKRSRCKLAQVVEQLLQRRISQLPIARMDCIGYLHLGRHNEGRDVVMIIRCHC